MMTTRLTTIELQKENMKFSAGHFTIFAPDNRENLHGHNYAVHAAITTEVGHNGLTFDYRVYKQKLLQLCRELNQTMLLPAHSPYMTIEETDDMVFAVFANEKIPFLKRDVLILPLVNITVEELSSWFIQQLTKDPQTIVEHKLRHLEIKVFSGPGQSGSCSWVNPS